MCLFRLSLYSGSGNDASAGDTSPPVAAVEQAPRQLDGPTNLQLDANADDTVTRVLEWMHSEPAFGDMPWSEFDNAGRIAGTAGTSQRLLFLQRN